MYTKFSLAIIGFAIGASAMKISHDDPAAEAPADADPCDNPTDLAWIAYCDE